MIRRKHVPIYSHGGAFLAGITFATYRVWIMVAAAFLLGVAAHWAWRTTATLADHFLWKRKRRLTATRGVKRETERVSAQTDTLPF